MAAVMPNPSIERTCPGKPGHASHVKVRQQEASIHSQPENQRDLFAPLLAAAASRQIVRRSVKRCGAACRFADDCYRINSCRRLISKDKRSTSLKSSLGRTAPGGCGRKGRTIAGFPVHPHL